jgi:hypothetical protein
MLTGGRWNVRSVPGENLDNSRGRQYLLLKLQPDVTSRVDLKQRRNQPRYDGATAHIYYQISHLPNPVLRESSHLATRLGSAYAIVHLL